MQKFAAFIAKLPRNTLTVLCVAAILYLTLVPKPLPDNSLQLIPGMDKIAHAIMFGGLVLCMAADYSRRLPRCQPGNMRLLAYAAVSTVFGGIIELLQNYMGLGRGGDIYDFIADAVGCIVFAFALTPPLLRALKFEENR